MHMGANANAPPGARLLETCAIDGARRSRMTRPLGRGCECRAETVAIASVSATG